MLKIRGRTRWTRIQQANFLKSLGTLLDKGYTISESLTLLSFQSRSHTYVPIDVIKKDLMEGRPLFESLERQRIPSDILGYLYFASEQGKLSFGLLEGSAILRKREELRKSFIHSIRYPVVLLIILTIMMFFMLKFLFPQFSKLFQSVNISLPSITLYLITFLELIPVIVYLTVTFSLLLFLIYYARFKQKSAMEKLHFWLKFPLLREVLKTVLTHYIAFQLGHLLQGGLSITQALKLFEEQRFLKLFQEESTQLQAELRKGKSLNETFKDKPYYLPELAMVTFLGQSKGRLGEELVLYSELIIDDAEERLRSMLALIQPVMFAAIGSIVLILFLSVMIPVFQLFQSL